MKKYCLILYIACINYDNKLGITCRHLSFFIFHLIFDFAIFVDNFLSIRVTTRVVAVSNNFFVEVQQEIAFENGFVDNDVDLFCA